MRKVVYGGLAVGLFALALFIYHERTVNQARREGQQAARAALLPPPPPPPRIVHHSDALVSGAFAIGSGEVKRIPILVTKDMSNVKLVGRFQASGGTRDDIEVILFGNPDDFTNWKSGNDSRAIYQSGRTTVANIDVSLGTPATYDLVFSNRHAILLRRDITADVKLEYDQREK